MKTYEKILFEKDCESPLAWTHDHKAKTKIEVVFLLRF